MTYLSKESFLNPQGFFFLGARSELYARTLLSRQCSHRGGKVIIKEIVDAAPVEIRSVDELPAGKRAFSSRTTVRGGGGGDT